MKRYLLLLITLSLYCTISYSQKEELCYAKLVRINDGDSTFYCKTFEIDAQKKRVFTINPIINYLDIKGGKPKYKVKLKKMTWNRIEGLLKEINLSHYEKVEFDYRKYSITLFDDNFKSQTYTTQLKYEEIKLKEIVKCIREN
ncbi:hypothetical protein [Plebeiibacterium sediminum]|uniref:Uncharacterized protein n=1 Tax=Plebeiibacterium sediminum TaxID=2992112 RepID=A0AAE3M1J3_9BACT|nr:hypothetical protein [Plebeiobacterium sediminum]MCW3785423.1 hypothetical protein [Plebeiobacterium sediminum]